MEKPLPLDVVILPDLQHLLTEEGYRFSCETERLLFAGLAVKTAGRRQSLL